VSLRNVSGLQESQKDLYNQPILKLAEFIAAAYEENPNMSLEVFVHKAEKLQEDDKIGMFRM
jgi:Ras-related GTP-binding protein C/D